MNYGAIILGGGNSKRMNFPKIYLNINGKSFLQKITEEYYKAGVKNICLVINKNYCEGEWKYKFGSVKQYISKLKKTNADKGRFNSVKLGVKNLLDCDFVFIHNADNPFINKNIINQLQQNKNPHGYTQIVFDGKSGHPVLISKKVAQKINEIKYEDYNLRDVLKEFPKRLTESKNEGVLANINTKEDYEKYFRENSRSKKAK